MKKVSKLPTILGLIALIAGLGAGVILVQFRQVFRLSAAPEITPKNVRVVNVTDTSFAVTWTTDKKTVGLVEYGVNPALGQSTPAQNAANTHLISLEGLAESERYFVKINSEGTLFDNNGVPWEAQTGAVITSAAPTGVLSGSVVTPDNSPVAGALVLITSPLISPVAAITSDTGTWVIPKSIIRGTSLTTFAPLSTNTTLLEILVTSETGLASAQIYAPAASQTPPIVIGSTHDFRNQSTETNANSLPASELNLPSQSDSSPSSGFVIPESSVQGVTNNVVTLESIAAGEAITTTEPEFFGEAPPGTVLTIKVESEDPQTGQVTVGADGEWSWTPPTGLAEGTHKISIEWQDANGILRTLTRSFTVQAASGPAFESTPSATLKPTPTASPTAAPRKAIPATESPVPDSGVSFPTFFLLIIAITSLIMSVSIWKALANNP